MEFTTPDVGNTQFFLRVLVPNTCGAVCNLGRSRGGGPVVVCHSLWHNGCGLLGVVETAFNADLGFECS